MEQERKENKMGVMPIGKLLISMSIPLMISMLVQALYNIVDSIYVSRIGQDALTAVSLAFPVQSLMIAVSVGTGVGLNSLLSRRLGEKKFDEVNTAAVNGIFLYALSAVLFAVLGGLFSRAFFEAFTDKQAVIDMGVQYLTICTVFSVGLFMQIAAERLMQATGNTLYNMIVQVTGAVINIVLDPILIFGLLGMPKMGIAGAAVATVTGQIVAMVFGFWLNHFKNHEVKISFMGFKPDFEVIKDIYRVGFPSIIMQSIMSLLTVCLNKILMNYGLQHGETAVSIYGVYFKLQSFVFMPVFGLNNALVPIVAYNYGARNKSRMTKATWLAAAYSCAIMFIGTLVFELIPDKLLLMFDATPDMYAIGVPALRIISLCFVFAGFSIVLSSVFQALGHGVLSMGISIVRQLVVILPVAYIFARFIGLNAVWFAFPISEIVATVITVIAYKYVYSKNIKNI